MRVRRKFVSSKLELDREVDDYLINGYKVVHSGDSKVGVSKKSFGDPVKHIFIAIGFVGGIALILFVVNYFTNFMSVYAGASYSYYYGYMEYTTVHNEYYLLSLFGLIANVIYLINSYKNSEKVIIEIANGTD